MSDKQVLLIVASVLLMSHIAIASSEDQSRELNLSINDQTIIAPFYDKTGLTQFPAQRLMKDMELMRTVRNFIMDAINDTVVKKKSFFALLPYIQRVYTMINDFKNDFRQLGRAGLVGTPVSDAFVKNTVDMLKQVFRNRVGETTIGTDEQAIREFVEGVNGLLDIAEKTVMASPVGIYLDWVEYSIDGKKIPEIAPYYVEFMRKNGKGVWLMEKVLDFL